VEDNNKIEMSKKVLDIISSLVKYIDEVDNQNKNDMAN